MLRKISFLMAVSLLGGCDVGSNYTGSYVGGDDTGIIHLNLVEADDKRINATVSVSQLDYDAGKLKAKTVGMTGIRDADAINLLSSNGSGGSMTLIGTKEKLVWQIPTTGQSIEFVETDQAGYQKRLIELSKQLNANDVGLLPDDL
jgi:hypothetical protein